MSSEDFKLALETPGTVDLVEFHLGMLGFDAEACTKWSAWLLANPDEPFPMEFQRMVAAALLAPLQRVRVSPPTREAVKHPARSDKLRKYLDDI